MPALIPGTPLFNGLWKQHPCLLTFSKYIQLEWTGVNLTRNNTLTSLEFYFYSWMSLQCLCLDNTEITGYNLICIPGLWVLWAAGGGGRLWSRLTGCGLWGRGCEIPVNFLTYHRLYYMSFYLNKWDIWCTLLYTQLHPHSHTHCNKQENIQVVFDGFQS